jgi:hypothetical protein
VPLSILIAVLDQLKLVATVTLSILIAVLDQLRFLATVTLFPILITVFFPFTDFVRQFF